MSDIKTLRKQLRNVVQEILPEILTAELVATIRKDQIVQIDARLNALAKQIQQTLDTIDQRSKDVQAYNIRQSASMLPIQDTNKT